MAAVSKKTPSSALRPRARLLRTLGEELISNEVVAVIELVKNAYDADAKQVLIRFVGPLEPGQGRIEVIDNGHGMALETVRTIWMEPATSSKRGIVRRTEKLRRRFLGEKGIGRFASSRLANELEVVSRRNGETKEVYALFDWRQFDDDEKYLDEVFILWEEREPREICREGSIELLSKDGKSPGRRVWQGTLLKMSGLKQKWETKQFEDLRRGLARLVSPKSSKDEKDAFEVELSVPEEFEQFNSKVEPPAILKHPHYTVKGTVSGDGKYKLTYKTLAEGVESVKKGQFLRLKNLNGRFVFRSLENDATDSEGAETRLIECGPLEIELRIWDRDELGNVVQKTHSTIRDVRRDLDAVAGVNIFRDNFRVLPYGEPNDDWLRLDIRRVQNPTMRLSNNQIYGIVQITADDNPKLKDQSNREGLDENQAMQDLREMLTTVLSHLEAMRYSARPRNETKGKPVGGLFSGFDLKPLSDYIAKEHPNDKQAQELVEKVDAQFSEQLKEIQSVLARYQRLATLGQLIDHVLHEGRQPIASINNESELGLSDLERSQNLGSELMPKLTGRFNTIRGQGDILATAFRRMEPFGGRKRGRPSQLYLEDIIRDAFGVYEGDLAKLNVKTTLPRGQTLVRVDSAEMQEVIVNLLQNSLYWLEQVGESRREIVVTVERKGPEHLDILFSDSGPGVPVENRELIFDPYFSTKPEGVGLGLAIVGEIVSDYYGGSLELLERGPLKGANFLVTLRKRV
jgi:signal transduction histidine kinase